MNTLIVDDEQIARQNLIDLLKKYPFTGKIHEAENADEALKHILQTHPELMFLDIDMPGKSGIELMQRLQKLELSLQVVFVTAFNQHAIKAIKCAAFDYILKPVDPEEFDVMMRRLQKKLKQKNPMQEQINSLINQLIPQKIKIKTKRGISMISPEDIVYAESKSNYTEIILRNGTKQMVTITLGKVHDMLPDCRFIRVGRSHVINRDFFIATDHIKKEVRLLVDDQAVSLKISPKGIRELENMV